MIIRNSHIDALHEIAELALTRYFAALIRESDDPDHSGPEDAAAIFAGRAIELGNRAVNKGDWREVIA
jgi:hypothetical protein